MSTHRPPRNSQERLYVIRDAMDALIAELGFTLNDDDMDDLTHEVASTIAAYLAAGTPVDAL